MQAAMRRMGPMQRAGIDEKALARELAAHLHFYNAVGYSDYDHDRETFETPYLTHDRVPSTEDEQAVIVHVELAESARRPPAA